MFFFPCLFLSSCAFPFFSQRWTEEQHEVPGKQNPCTNLRARQYLHASLLCHPQRRWLCQLLSRPLTACLACHAGPPCCSVASQLGCAACALTTSPPADVPFPVCWLGLGKATGTAKRGGREVLSALTGLHCPSFVQGLATQDHRESCVWDQAVNLPVVLSILVSDRGVSVSKIRISYKVCESKCLSGGKWCVRREETVSLCYTDIRVTKGKRCWKPSSWELLSEGNHSHLGKRRIFLMTCLFSSAFIYNIDYSSYFWFGVAKCQRWKHRFSMLFKTNL